MTDTLNIELVIRDGVLRFGESPDADELIAPWLSECIPDELLYGEYKFTVKARVEWTTDIAPVPMLIIEGD